MKISLMMNKPNHIWAFIIVIIFSVVLVYAQQNSEVSLQLGLAELYTENLAIKNTGSYISAQLLDYLTAYIIFPIDNPEIFKNVLLREQNKSVTSLQKELGTLKEKIDTTVLISDKKKQQKTYTELIQTLLQKQEIYEKLTTQSIDTAKSYPLKITVSKALYNPKLESPDIFCIRKSLDFLVFGTIKTIDTLLLIDLQVYAVHENAIIYSTTVIGDETSIIKSLADKSVEITEAIIEKKFCVIKFTGNPANASITVNNNSLEYPTYVCLDPHNISITISAQGYKKHSDKLSLMPGEQFVYSYELAPIPLKTISIITNPEGADIYLNSIPVGKSPLQVEVNPEQDTITANKDNYESAQVSLDKVNGELTINMQESTGKSFDDTFEDAKGRFYKSLGWFVLSLPLSTLSYGSFMSVYQTELELLNKLYTGQINLSEAIAAEQALSARFCGYQITFWVSVVLSSGLGINAIINLIRYISVM